MEPYSLFAGSAGVVTVLNLGTVLNETHYAVVSPFLRISDALQTRYPCYSLTFSQSERAVHCAEPGGVRDLSLEIYFAGYHYSAEPKYPNGSNHFSESLSMMGTHQLPPIQNKL